MNERQIVFVTSNLGKVKSAKRCLRDVEVIQYNAELIEPRGDDIREIAKQKVKQAYKIAKKPCIAMDAGFFIEELNGFPRAYVNHTLDTIGIEGILKLMEGKENRGCEFKECLAYYDGDIINFFEGVTKLKVSKKGNVKSSMKN
ncbi:non-canonical purine NTP pyrophosphatase [Dethiothermospora halolimnae]|uniref:non-canonical purine NTP pyrophosphatase n=1 Tax=Dethiothermospora halolimnae TaxID=3114390 RepID=UPI003CCBA29A